MKNETFNLVNGIRKWARSNVLTPTRTYGDIVFNKNGDSLDIWIRINGKPKWFSVNREHLLDFLNNEDIDCISLNAGSDNNAEE